MRKLIIILLVSCFVSCKTTNVNTSKNKVSVSNYTTKPINYFAKEMGVKPSEIKNIDFYTTLYSWLGVPYKYGGNDKKGVDCSGFVCQVFKKYTKNNLPRRSADLAKIIEKKNKSHLKEGDLIFFNYDAKNSHVGIYLRNGRFIHSSTKKGVIVSNLNDEWYSKKYNQGGSLKGILW